MWRICSGMTKNANKSSSQFPNDQTKCIKIKKRESNFYSSKEVAAAEFGMRFTSRRELQTQAEICFSVCNKRKPENLCINLRDSSNEITFLLFFFAYIYTTRRKKRKSLSKHIIILTPAHHSSPHQAIQQQHIFFSVLVCLPNVWINKK